MRARSGFVVLTGGFLVATSLALPTVASATSHHATKLRPAKSSSVTEHLSPTSGPPGTSVTVSGTCGKASGGHPWTVEVGASVGSKSLNRNATTQATGKNGAYKVHIIAKSAGKANLPKPGNTVTFAVTCLSYQGKNKTKSAHFKVTAGATVKVAASSATVKGNKVGIKLSCAKAACHGKAKLTSSKGTLASGKVKIAKGHASTVKLSLTSAGKKAFKHAHSHAVSAKLIVSLSDGFAATKTIKVH
jgi:hypothetical protein